MSDATGDTDATGTMHRIALGGRGAWLWLPHALDAVLADWKILRGRMAREIAPGFARDEWAYLLAFVDPEALAALFERELGARVPADDPRADAPPPTRILRPRSPVAVWLPSNVSLLGPLMVALLGTVGAEARLKAGSRADDLAASFVAWGRARAGDGPLGTWLRHHVRVEHFDRTDARNAAFSTDAALRVVFGSDDAVAAVSALPHPASSALLGFGDHVSQAWISPGASRDSQVIDALVRVFAIYGSAGCTSPRRVVVVGGSDADADALRDALVQRWPAVARAEPAAVDASECFATMQVARALGWRARLTPRSAAVISSGALDALSAGGRRHLEIAPAPLAAAAAALPLNVQTIGHAGIDAVPPAPAPILDKTGLALLLARSPVKRIVPLARMHHMGSVWDGLPLVQSLFEHVELG
jgi:hypothetical protein